MTCRLRSAAFWCTVGATPWAENTTIAPSGTSSVSSTKIAPALASVSTTCAVVHDLVADVHRRAVLLQRPLDGLDGAVDTGAVSARLGQQHPLAGQAAGDRARGTRNPHVEVGGMVPRVLTRAAPRGQP